MQPRYHVQLLDMTGGSFAPGNVIAEFPNAVNLGYANYINDVGEAFFTISQDDPFISLIRPNRYKSHVRIYRDSNLVWAGILAEWGASERDAIIYAYGYESLFYFITSAFNVAYTNAQIDTIVSDAFDLAKTGYTSTLSGWLTKGTIEAPVTTSGGAIPIVLPSYREFFKRPLHLFREMSTIAIGDTTNVVKWSVSPTGVFVLQKNGGSDLDDTWRYGDGIVKGFYETQTPILRRNDLPAVGVNPNDVTLRTEVSDAADITTNGRRMEPLFFSWVRDSTELGRVANLRLKRAMRDVPELSVAFYKNSMIPPNATGATWDIGDRVNISINRGITQLNAREMVWGYQVLFVRGSEEVRALVQQRPG